MWRTRKSSEQIGGVVVLSNEKKNFCLQLLNDIGEELINGVGVVVAKLSFQW